MTSITASLTIEVPDQHVIDLLDCAGYGIGYWASRATVNTEERTYTVLEQDEDQPARVVTFSQIADALVRLGAGDFECGDTVRRYASAYVTDMLTVNQLDDATGNFDSDLGDVIVQLAFFDEIVYG